MKYVCVECRYTYDEAFGDSGENLDAGKNLYELDNFSCPGCGSSVDTFQEVQEEVLRADNPEYLSMIESEHIPMVRFLDDKPGVIEVLVGDPPHSMFEEHYIGTISLHDEDGDMVEEKSFSPYDDPVTKFDISDLDFFTIRVKCNQHGIWSTRIIENIC